MRSASQGRTLVGIGLMLTAMAVLPFLDAIARIQIDVDKVHTLPVPGGVQGIGGKLRDETRGEHAAITFAQALTDWTGGAAVMITC